MQILYEGKWVDFYPIVRPVVYREELDKRPLEELDEEVYGKFVMGMMGYVPAWMYKTVKKSEIRP